MYRAAYFSGNRFGVRRFFCDTAVGVRLYTTSSLQVFSAEEGGGFCSTT